MFPGTAHLQPLWAVRLEWLSSVLGLFSLELCAVFSCFQQKSQGTPMISVTTTDEHFLTLCLQCHVAIRPGHPGSSYKQWRSSQGRPRSSRCDLSDQCKRLLDEMSCFLLSLDSKGDLPSWRCLLLVLPPFFEVFQFEMKVSAQSSLTLPSKLQALPFRRSSYRHHTPRAGAALEENRVGWFTQSSWAIYTAGISRYLSCRFLHLFALIYHFQKGLNSLQNNWLRSAPKVFLQLMHRETLTPLFYQSRNSKAAWWTQTLFQMLNAYPWGTWIWNLSERWVGQPGVSKSVAEVLHALSHPLASRRVFSRKWKRSLSPWVWSHCRLKTHAEPSPTLRILSGNYTGQGCDTIVLFAVLTRRDTTFFSCDTGQGTLSYQGKR